MRILGAVGLMLIAGTVTAPTRANVLTFDLAAWEYYGNEGAEDPDPSLVNVVTQITIRDGNDNILDNIPLLTVNGVGHYHYGSTFSSMNGIKIQFGPDASYVGIDNIDFSIEVSEPASLTLFGTALAGLGFLRHYRR